MNTLRGSLHFSGTILRFHISSSNLFLKLKKHKRNRKINKIKMQFIKIQNGPQKCILFSFLFLQGPTRKQTKKVLPEFTGQDHTW